MFAEVEAWLPRSSYRMGLEAVGNLGVLDMQWHCEQQRGQTAKSFSVAQECSMLEGTAWQVSSGTDPPAVIIAVGSHSDSWHLSAAWCLLQAKEAMQHPYFDDLDRESVDALDTIPAHY